MPLHISTCYLCNVFEFFLFIPICWLFILYIYPSITRIASQFLIDWNTSLHLASNSFLTENAFIFGSIITPQMPGRYPTPQLTYAVLILSVLLIFLATRIRIPKPIAIYISQVMPFLATGMSHPKIIASQIAPTNGYIHMINPYNLYLYA